MLRDVLRWTRGHAREWSGANRRAAALLDGTRAVILMYHRVLPRAEADALAVELGMFVTPETFRLHLQWLRDEFRVLPLHEVVTRLAEGRDLPPRACAITFDDGWRDNHDYALPALEEAGLPATIFLVTDRVGTSGAFWPDEVCRRLCVLPEAEQRSLAQRFGAQTTKLPMHELISALKLLSEEERAAALEGLRACTPPPADAGRELMDWAEIERLGRAGIDLESHGTSHAILTEVGPERAAAELRRSLEELRERDLGRRGLIAYPSGRYDDTVRRLARECGYRAAVTTDRGLAIRGDDLFALPRLGVHDGSRTRPEFLRVVPGRGIR